MADHLRQRRGQNQQTLIQNGDLKHRAREYEQQDPEFAPRESPLTNLFENSRHIKAIYHIFFVILLVLLCDTVIYDLVESGKVNVGISTVVNGFGDVRRGAKLWLFDFLIAVAFYPALRFYAAGAKLFRKVHGLDQLWLIVGVVGLIAIEGTLLAVPIWDLNRKYLAVGSSATVTTEMFRLAMKIWAVAAACAPRCHSDSGPPLPSFQHYMYFLFAPTLVYRDRYPRTKQIRWGKVVFHLLEVAAIIFYNSFLWERFILPYWSDYGKEPTVEAGTLVRSMFACVLPGVISFLCGFYCVLHAWLNAFAEMLTFADRLFYEEWWTTSQFSRYYRMWNRVVYSWLRDHIYKPLAPHTGRTFASFSVFLTSAIAHEVILALSFGYFYPVLLLQFGIIGFLLVPLTSVIGRRFPDTFNLLMWLSFFLGNGLLWSLYPMEYFARKNCPPSEGDSFLLPKSWTCPEVILKPNWTFQNPFSLPASTS